MKVGISHFILNRSPTLTDPNAPKSSSNFQSWEGSSAFVNQGGHWSSAFIWISSSLFGFTLLWAFTSKLDQTISVRGVLKPAASTRIVEAPSSGVIRTVFVKDGDSITSGTPLVKLESESISSRLNATLDTIQLVDYESSALQIVTTSPSSEVALNRLRNLPIPASSSELLVGRLSSARDQSLQTISQLQQLSNRITSKKESLRLQTRISADLRPLFEGGGLSRNAYYNQLNSLQEFKSEILSLEDERSRIIGIASSRLNNLNKQLINLESNRIRLVELLRNLTVLSPIAGTVFDIQVSPQSFVSSDDVLLKVVPDGPLSASLRIPNSDIGFVKKGQSVSISVDSFPAGEFGYIQGTLDRIGSDALPPDQSTRSVYFPGFVSLDSQKVLSGPNQLNLQSGMSISANIKLRARPTISIVTDLFTRQLEGVKTFR